MEAEKRPSVHDINELARKHTPGYYLFERRQIENMRESLAGYGLALARAQSDMAVMMERLLRVVEIHDAARARKDYATSDAIRQALDCTYPFRSTSKERADRYMARFDVATERRMVNFLTTPPDK